MTQTITLTIVLELPDGVALEVAQAPALALVREGHTDPPATAETLPDEHPSSLYQRTCQKCGATFKSRNGRLIHNGRVHGDDPDHAAYATAIDDARKAPAAFEVFRGRRLGDAQRSILEALATRHGRISDPKGGATARLAQLAAATGAQTSVNATLRRLEELGHLERQISGRRCFRITLTPAGWEAIGKTPPPFQRLRHGRSRPGRPSRSRGACHA